ncbi:MAG: hypothetical protein PHS80_00305 [Methanothrix sp.]|nr:hypothetical protein [Methanothrix sp.]
MIENKSIPFENDAPIEITCPDCGHVWESKAKGRVILCGMCGKRIKNPNNPHADKTKQKKYTIVCSVCKKEMGTDSTRYRITCSNCGAWVINENAKYKPTR